MSVIADTTVLSNFASIRHLQVLKEIFGVVYITPQVYEEIRAGLRAGYLYYQDVEEGLKEGWLKFAVLTEEEMETCRQFLQKLGAGEASALAVASHRDWLLVTDDLRARKTAKKRNVKFAGTIGCLIRAVRTRICTMEQANAWLAEMIETGYYSPVTRLENLGEI